MIDFPNGTAPTHMEPYLRDFGGVMQPVLGGPGLRINRLGNRYGFRCEMPVLTADQGRLFRARLVRAKSVGLRMPVWLARGQQGAPGIAAVVDGAGQSGTVLNVRGIAPNYQGLEGYWISIIRDGQRFLDMAAANFTADGAGDAAIPLCLPLRTDFADGAVVELAAPMVEGFVTEDISWAVSNDGLVSLSFSIEEAE